MEATLYINTKAEWGAIHPHIYGHFLEHTANAIYGGIYDPGSALSDEHGFRQDVVEAARKLRAPILRWPGGNFASVYHWRDGVGPKEQRPRRAEIAWSHTPADPFPVEESNQFGTNEFIEFCRTVGADPYLNFNMGSGDFLEAMRWMEYCNHEGRTEMAELRRSHGYERGHGVRYWGIGNEVWGEWQVGHTSATEYAVRARDVAWFARHLDPESKILIVGWVDPRWNLEVLDQTAPLMDYLTIHLYTRTDFRQGKDDYYESLGGSVGFERVLRSVAEQVAGYRMRHGIRRPIYLSVDEWNLMHRGTPESVPDGRYGRSSPRTMMDALFVAGVFNGFHRLAGSVKMGNYVQLVNNHAAILAAGEQLVTTPVYHVLDLYRNVMGDRALHCVADCQSRRAPVNVSRMTFEVDLPYVDASATLSQDGRTLALSIVNRHRDEAAECTLDVAGCDLPDQGDLYLLTADEPFAENTFDTPETVHPVASHVRGNRLVVPPHSLAVVRWEIDQA